LDDLLVGVRSSNEKSLKQVEIGMAKICKKIEEKEKKNS
jgi:hypothetical protein